VAGKRRKWRGGGGVNDGEVGMMMLGADWGNGGRTGGCLQGVQATTPLLRPCSHACVDVVGKGVGEWVGVH